MTSRRRRRTPAPRDQSASPFAAILQQLLDATPGSNGAALVDHEGETVDYAGTIDPFDLKVAAAHFQIVLGELNGLPSLAGVRQLIVRARAQSYVIRQIPSSYAIVLLLHHRAAFSASARALQEAHVRLCLEAGFPPPPRASRWFAVDVDAAKRDRTRPERLRLGNAWEPVEVMGSVVGLRPRERGFRVRLSTGAEMMLVREPHGRWFTDEHF
jgi:hypothetical protein